jgi:chromosome segregation ATPase
MKILKYQQIHSRWLEFNLGGVFIMNEKTEMVKDAEQLGLLREKLLNVSDEIDAVKNSFSRNAEDLSRIQTMLSLEHLDEISGILDKFENRISEAEQRKVEASEGARKYSEELEKEKERLIKLWDAYKNQEEELSVAEKKAAELEERVRVAETSKNQLEEDMTARINTLSQKLGENEEKIRQFDDFKQRCEDFDEIRNNLEEEIHSLKEENRNKESMINDLNTQIEKLQKLEDFSEYKEKFETITTEYEKEKERLTKLYQLYEETDSDCKRLSSENKRWQSWYDSNKEIFNKLFSTAPPIGTTENTEDTKSDEPTEKVKSPKKTKRRFKFKK